VRRFVWVGGMGLAFAWGCSDSPLEPPGPTVAAVHVKPNPASVLVGQTLQLHAMLFDAAGNLLPDRPVEWSSSDPAIATVSAAGVVTAVAPGTVTIVAKSEGKTGASEVTASMVPVASVTVSPDPAALAVYDTLRLTATAYDADGNVLVGRGVTWASSDTSVATVDALGLLRGRGAGSATITATSEGKSGTTVANVSPPPVASVTLDPSSALIVKGRTRALTVTLRDAAGKVLTDRAVAWASSNPAAATVSSTGVVSAVDTGRATITATSEGKSASAAVGVALAAGTYSNVAYCAPNSLRKLDLYVPGNSLARPLPAAVFLHGGGWTGGDKTAVNWRFTAVRDALLARGYLVANLNYRLASTSGNQWPAQINDAKCAVRQLRAKWDLYGVDTLRMGAWGTSAGAHLAALLGLTVPSDGLEGSSGDPFLDRSSRVQAVVTFAAPTDLTRPSEFDSANVDFPVVFPSWPDSLGPEMVNASPVSHPHTRVVPFLMYHDPADPVVAFAQAQRLQDSLVRYGAPVTLHAEAGAGHGFDTVSPTRQSQIVQEVAGFFDTYLKNAAAPAWVVAALESRP